MKLFGLRNLIGLAAIGGAVAYARKHGGFKNALNELMSKKDQLLSKVQQGQQGQHVDKSGSSIGSSYTGSVGSSGVRDESIGGLGSTSGSGLGGSGGYGGGNGYGGR